MEDTEIRTLKAGETQLEYLDDNNSAWTGDTAMGDVRDDLHDKIEEIKVLEQIQKNDNSGLAVGKDVLKLEAAKKGLVVCKVMKVYARRTGNDTLKGEIDFTLSDLYHTSDENTADRLLTVFNRGTTHVTAMIAAGYHITAGDVTAVGTARTAFVDSENKPQVAKVGVKVATYNIKGAVKELDDIAEDVIDLANGYLITNADFVKGVTDAYRKGSVGVRHLSLVMSYVDDVTGVALKGVNATITNGVVTITGKSTKLGNVREKSMENGNYTVTSELLTYITDVQTGVGIEEGKIKKITVRLRKV